MARASIRTSSGQVSLNGSEVDVNGIKIINLATPTAPTDACTKAYADSVGGGASYDGDEFAALTLTGGGIKVENSAITQRLQNGTLTVTTSGSAVANATATSSVEITTGAKSAGTGNSGGVTITTGNSSSGYAGDIVINPGAGAGAVRGNFYSVVPLGMSGQKITGMGTPTAGTDACTKAYVDLVAPAVEIIQNTETDFAPVSSNTWMEMTDNYISLTSGKWEINGAVLFSGGTAFTEMRAGFFASNGENTGTNPDALTKLTPGSSVFQYYSKASSTGEYAALAPMIVNVGASLDVYLVPRVVNADIATVTINTYLWARKLNNVEPEA